MDMLDWDTDWSRSPYGERGLKFDPVGAEDAELGRSPYGERGLKFIRRISAIFASSRSPYGERGLKSASWHRIQG